MSLRTALRFALAAILTVALIGTATAQMAQAPMPQAKKHGEFSVNLQIGGSQLIQVQYELKIFGSPSAAPLPREVIRIKPCVEEEVVHVEGPGQLRITPTPAARCRKHHQDTCTIIGTFRLRFASRQRAIPSWGESGIPVAVFLPPVCEAYPTRSALTAGFGPVPLELPQGLDITGHSAIDPFSVQLFSGPPPTNCPPTCNEMNYTWNYTGPTIAQQQTVPMPRAIVDVIGMDNPRYNSWVYGHRGTRYERSIIPAYPHGFYQARMVCQQPFPGATSVHHEAPGGWWLDATPVPQPRHVMPVVVVQQVWERGPAMVADVRGFGLRLESECTLPPLGYSMSAVGATSGPCCQSAPVACCEKAGKLAGTWYRDLEDMVVSATFNGDEIRLCITQCADGNTVCFTLTAEYAITKEGLAHGVVTGIDVDLKHDPKSTTPSPQVGDLTEIAAELQKFVDSPFSFRVKSTSAGMMVSGLKVAVEVGKKDLVLAGGLYKPAKDGCVPTPKPMKIQLGGLSSCEGPACRDVQVEVRTLPLADPVPVMPTPAARDRSSPRPV